MPNLRFVGADPSFRQLGSNVSSNLSQAPSPNLVFEGSAAFASRNTLRGCQYSFRDDLESLGYLLVYIVRGWLPWLGTEEKKDDGWCYDEESVEATVDRVLRHKLRTAAANFKPITEGFPAEMYHFFEYVDSLEFGALPEYE
jgi:serine/threonine protein kinase